MAVRRSIQRLFYPAAFLAICSAGCSDTPTQPSDPPVTVACPANQTQQATNGTGALVSYQAPTAAGGTAPLTVACNPPSPTFFQIGTTPVACTATDAKNKTASCSFQVTVTSAPRLSATSIIGFGDSISDGVLGLTALASGPGDPGPTVGYVYKLRTLLQARYVAQTIVMTDEGCPGEMVSTATSNPGCQSQGGIYRLPTALSRDRPQAMLLLEGINDLNGSGGDAISTVISGLRTMVRQGRGSGIPVFLSTILPERPGGSRAQPGAIVAIPPTNDQIRQLATAEGAYLVDMFAAFDGQTATLLGPDGLHPNDAGYTKMAEVFFDAIKSKLEMQPTTTMFQFPFPMAR